VTTEPVIGTAEAASVSVRPIPATSAAPVIGTAEGATASSCKTG
jgi:hypothetical protein